MFPSIELQNNGIVYNALLITIVSDKKYLLIITAVFLLTGSCSLWHRLLCHSLVRSAFYGGCSVSVTGLSCRLQRAVYKFLLKCTRMSVIAFAWFSRLQN